MRFPTILAITLAAVLASSLILIGPFSIKNILPAGHEQHSQEAEAVVMPLTIRDRFTAIEMAGDAADGKFMKVSEDFVDPENHCEFCTRVEYTPGPQGQAGFSYEDSKGLELSSALSLRFWAMGEEGGEKIKFKVAGKTLDKLQGQLGKLTSNLTNSIFKSVRFALTTDQVTLGKDWKKYEIDLRDVDLKGITHPFAIELAGNSTQKEVIFIKGVVYDNQPAEEPIAATAEDLNEPLTTKIISDNAKNVAPGTLTLKRMLPAAEPYSISWNYGDGKKGAGETVSHF